MEPEEKETLPKEVRRGKITIGGIELEVVNLDNGQRVVTVESFKEFLRVLDEARKEENV